jgi:hypothetical protein
LLKRASCSALGLCWIVASWGCSSAPPPNDQLTAAQAAVRAAEEVDAKELPKAALYLKLAQEQIEKAKLWIENRENERALWVLRRAEADAEVAIALAKEKRWSDEADRALKEIQKLKQGAQ